MKRYAAGSVEFHETPLFNGDTPITPTSVVVAGWEEPTPLVDDPDWTAPTVLEGKHGLMVGAYPAGYYRTYARRVDNPERPIVETEPFTITG